MNAPNERTPGWKCDWVEVACTSHSAGTVLGILKGECAVDGQVELQFSLEKMEESFHHTSVVSRSIQKICRVWGFVGVCSTYLTVIYLEHWHQKLPLMKHLFYGCCNGRILSDKMQFTLSGILPNTHMDMDLVLSPKATVMTLLGKGHFWLHPLSSPNTIPPYCPLCLVKAQWWPRDGLWGICSCVNKNVYLANPHLPESSKRKTKSLDLSTYQHAYSAQTSLKTRLIILAVGSVASEALLPSEYGVTSVIFQGFVKVCSFLCGVNMQLPDLACPSPRLPVSFSYKTILIKYSLRWIAKFQSRIKLKEIVSSFSVL